MLIKALAPSARLSNADLELRGKLFQAASTTAAVQIIPEPFQQKLVGSFYFKPLIVMN